MCYIKYSQRFIVIEIYKKGENPRSGETPNFSNTLTRQNLE